MNTSLLKIIEKDKKMPHNISNFLNRLPSIESILYVSITIGTFIFLLNLPNVDDEKRVKYILTFIGMFLVIMLTIINLSIKGELT